MGWSDLHRWDDGQLMALVARELHGGEAGCAGLPLSSALALRPAALTRADVAAAGRAAFSWLGVFVELRNVIRHQEPADGASTDLEPGN